MSFIGDMFGGGGNQPAGTTNVTTSAEINPTIEPFIGEVLKEAQKQFQTEEFQTFPGPRIAEFDPAQQQAFKGIQSLVGSGLGSAPNIGGSAQLAKQAQDALAQGTQQVDITDIERLSNPYQQAVIDIQKREALRDFEGSTLPQIGAQAAGSGAFGGSRQAVLESEARRNLDQRLADIQATGSQQAYNQALAELGREKARQQTGAGLYGQFAQQFPTQGFKELTALQAIGETQQQRDQRALDIALSDFLSEQQFPGQQLARYAGLVRGFPVDPTISRQEVTSMPSVPLSQQLMGLAGTGLAAYKAFAQAGGQIGSLIKNMKSGGQIQGGLSGLERHQNNINPRVRNEIMRLMEFFSSFRRNPGNATPEQIARMHDAEQALIQNRSAMDMAGLGAVTDEVNRVLAEVPQERVIDESVTEEVTTPTSNVFQYLFGSDAAGGERGSVRDERYTPIPAEIRAMNREAKRMDRQLREGDNLPEILSNLTETQSLVEPDPRPGKSIREDRALPLLAIQEKLRMEREQDRKDFARRASSLEGFGGLDTIKDRQISPWELASIKGQGLGTKSPLQKDPSDSRTPASKGIVTTFPWEYNIFDDYQEEVEKIDGKDVIIPRKHSDNIRKHPKYRERRDSRPPVDYMGPSYAVEEKESLQEFEPYGSGGAGTRIPKEMVEGRAPYNELFEMVKGSAVSPQLDEFEPAPDAIGEGREPYSDAEITAIMEEANPGRGRRGHGALPAELRGKSSLELQTLLDIIQPERKRQRERLKRNAIPYRDPRIIRRNQGGLISLANGNQVGEELMASLQGGGKQGTDLTVFDKVISEPVRQDNRYRPSYDPGRASFEEYKQTLGESRDYLTNYRKDLAADREAASKRRAEFDKRRRAAEEEAQERAEQSKWLLLAQAFSKFGSDADTRTGIIGKLAKHGGEAIDPLMKLRSDEAARKAQALIGEEERMESGLARDIAARKEDYALKMQDSVLAGKISSAEAAELTRIHNRDMDKATQSTNLLDVLRKQGANAKTIADAKLKLDQDISNLFKMGKEEKEMMFGEILSRAKDENNDRRVENFKEETYYKINDDKIEFTEDGIRLSGYINTIGKNLSMYDARQYKHTDPHESYGRVINDIVLTLTDRESGEVNLAALEKISSILTPENVPQVMGSLNNLIMHYKNENEEGDWDSISSDVIKEINTGW